jgi:outer membrane protein assembly factor BamB
VTPALLWRTRLSLGTINDALLVGKDRVALTVGGRLYLLDKSGAVVGGRSATAFERVSSAVVDEAGNYYFIGLNAYSTDADGNLRWIRPLSTSATDAPNAGKTSALGPDGTLYVGASDGAVWALGTHDGATRWRREVAKTGEGTPVIKAGIGSALMVVVRGIQSRPQLLDAQTGEPLASWGSGDGERFGLFAAPSLGIVTQRLVDHGGAYPWMHVAVLDECSRTKWTVPATRPQWPILIGPGDRLFMVERDDVESSQTFVSVYAPDGTRALGPTPAAPPWAIGADGTIYGVACDSSGHEGPSRLIAYDSALGEKWRLELGASCPSGGPVIDDTGKLYFTWIYDGVTEVVAVQTPSPGLADAAWPTRSHDVRGTRWVR